MNFEVTGKLHDDLGSQQVTERFRRREFILEIADGNYPQFVKFQLTQDKCELLDNFRVGNELKVSFNLSGRQGQDRNGNVVYYTNLSAWRIEAGAGGESVAAGGGYGGAGADRSAGGGFGGNDRPSGGGYGGGSDRGGSGDRGGYRNDRGGDRGGRSNSSYDDRKGGGRRSNNNDDDMPF